ncbi:MAG: formate dehydrogenase accessory sulfurtransferase FdhD [Burkholderiaceae bacterium]
MKPGDLSHHESQATAPAGSGLRRVLRAGEQTPGREETDLVAQEVPVALEYNGIGHATLLTSPTDLEDFAFGFSYTEGIIRSARDIYGMDIVERPTGFVIQVEMASACLNQLKLRRRSLAGRSGCGLCGIESLDEVRRELPALPTPSRPFSATAISTAVDQLRARQPLHLATGATHAAGWADLDGNIGQVREDVGRHNALDKLIGHLIRNTQDTTQGIAVISSRASFEMVQKAAAAGIPALAAVSAPTSYAIQMADELNLLLAGFARGPRFTVYSHPEYLSIPGSPS